ncbi:hypothetical protein D3C72_2394080 [compost metagenome]
MQDLQKYTELQTQYLIILLLVLLMEILAQYLRGYFLEKRAKMLENTKSTSEQLTLGLIIQLSLLMQSLKLPKPTKP